MNTTAMLHVLIALVWLFLSPNRDLPRLLTGLVIGYGVLMLFRPLLVRDRYLNGSLAFFKWVFAFLKALVLSQVRVAQLILFPRRHPVNPGFIHFPLGDLSDLEILILTHSISLTPGTTTVEVDFQTRNILIHALEAGDEEATVNDIRANLLEPLLRFTRP